VEKMLQIEGLSETGDRAGGRLNRENNPMN